MDVIPYAVFEDVHFAASGRGGMAADLRGLDASVSKAGSRKITRQKAE